MPNQADKVGHFQPVDLVTVLLIGGWSSHSGQVVSWGEQSGTGHPQGGEGGKAEALPSRRWALLLAEVSR